MHTPHFVISALALSLFAFGCDSGSMSPAPSGGGDAGTPSGETALTCLGPDRSPVDTCVVEPQGTVCELASNNACGHVELEEVWDGPEGPCLRLVIRNICDRTLYSVTCVSDVAGSGWAQCWWSSTLPGFALDVGECGTNGAYMHYHTQLPGEQSVISDACTGR